MLSPYAILEVEETATNMQIKKAYLSKVRQHPPERDSRGFQRIRAAFERIETKQDRLKYRLFHCGQPELEPLAEKWLEYAAGKRPTEKTITALLAAASSECRLEKD